MPPPPHHPHIQQMAERSNRPIHYWAAKFEPSESAFRARALEKSEGGEREVASMKRIKITLPPLPPVASP